MKILAELKEGDTQLTGLGEPMFYVECLTCREAITVVSEEEYGKQPCMTPEQRDKVLEFMRKHPLPDHKIDTGVAQFVPMGSS
jgi:hypothetical protein